MPAVDFHALPLWITLLLFGGAAVLVWIAGTRLAGYADVIAGRTGLSKVFLGIVLLAVAASLPEIATTVTGAFIGKPALVAGNLFGGISLQIAVLAITDLLAVRGALSRADRRRARRTDRTRRELRWRRARRRQHLAAGAEHDTRRRPPGQPSDGGLEHPRHQLPRGGAVPVADATYRRGPILAAVTTRRSLPERSGWSSRVFLLGLLERRDRTVLGMGIDSATVLVIYVVGMLGLYSLRG